MYTHIYVYVHKYKCMHIYVHILIHYNAMLIKQLQALNNLYLQDSVQKDGH